MTVGTVKWFSMDKGYGFIEPQDGSQDVFVHVTAVEASGINSLGDGQRVEYEKVSGKDGKSTAEGLVILS